MPGAGYPGCWRGLQLRLRSSRREMPACRRRPRPRTRSGRKRLSARSRSDSLARCRQAPLAECRERHRNSSTSCAERREKSGHAAKLISITPRGIHVDPIAGIDPVHRANRPSDRSDGVSPLTDGRHLKRERGIRLAVHQHHQARTTNITVRIRRDVESARVFARIPISRKIERRRNSRPERCRLRVEIRPGLK